MAKQPSRPIWSKRAADAEASARALAYCAGRDVVARPPADVELVPFDIWTNRAHCRMLKSREIISETVHRKITRALDRIERDWGEGAFKLDPTLEDVHINIERAVAELAGEEAAGVMHTARSRNDQSATDVRLWLRDRLLGRLEALAGVVEALARFAGRHAGTVAPGWTHGQPAMPTTLGHWAAAHGWALSRDLEALRAAWPQLNHCPLGAAASFGTSWKIDRRLTARLMGFDAPLPNSLDAISTRWEAEARVGGALALAMTHLSSLGQDLVFLSTPPRECLHLNDAHVTGSSIMPNKRNPDFAEVTRARALAAAALAHQLATVGRGALSGYNRDTQWTKYWIMDLVEEVGAAPEIFGEVIDGLEVDKKALEALAAEGFSHAADLADHLARTRGLPFRLAYHLVAESVALDEDVGAVRLETLNMLLERERIRPAMEAGELRDCLEPRRALERRVSLGGPAPKDVRAQAAALRKRATAARRWAVRTGNRLERLRESVEEG